MSPPDLATTGLRFYLPSLLGVVVAAIVRKHGKWGSRFALLCGAVGTMVTVMLLAVFPAPSLPPLVGPDPVGTRTFELPAAADGGQRLLVQAWYPAVPDPSVPLAPWLPDPALAPRIPFQRIGGALSRARQGLPLAERGGKFPVLFYEHSWTGHRAENVAQVEELASCGFVVFAVDHSGQAARVKYPDGTIVTSDLPAALDLSTEKNVKEFQLLAARCLVTRSQEIAQVVAAVRAGVEDFPAERLALDRLGAFGFSFGGSSALHLCKDATGFVAGANEDGFFFENDEPRGPFLFFDEQMPAWLLQQPTASEDAGQTFTRESEARILAAMKGASRYRVILAGTKHEAFSDRIFTTRIPRLARVGSRPAAEVHAILTAELVKFFRQQLEK